MKNKLFIIGIDKYTAHKPLNSCVRDVIDFKNILLEKYHFNEEDVYELLNERATNKNIQDALNGYSKTITPTDSLIIFFSGHGASDESDRGFWIPMDGGNDYTTWIPNETIVTLLNKIFCKHIFLICDCCFSNSLLITTGTKATSDYFKHSSRWALSSAFEESSDSDQYSNTLFAETIIKYLENSEADVRVSELIEEVKRVFLVNLQQPQGYPLRVNGHKGGEFVFEMKQEIDKRTLKGFIDFKKTLQLYKRNSHFTELASFEDKTRKVGFQLFQEVDAVIKKSTFYLYLYEGIIQTQTLKHLHEFHSQIFKEKNLIILIPREKNIQNQEARKRNILEKFKPINIFFIDDFIREQCTPKIIQEETAKFLSISNFVMPILNQEQESDAINKYLLEWFEKSGDPILIVKGTGGIGKTTFSQYIADIAQNKYPNTTVLFIDSVLIKDTLLKSRQNGPFKIYNFYEAFYTITESISEKLTEDQFRINIDAGNILLIIDGLDEVISKISNFDVKEFLKSIDESSNDLGGGKVIITCRTHFWDNIELSSHSFKIIELEPFNKYQARLFFEKTFGIDDPKTKKALKLAEEFRYPIGQQTNTYDPYVLDVIRSMISSEQESIETDLSTFSSKLLKNNIKNDYIIYRICDRERKRIGQISVDDQITFFIYLAVEKRGMIRGQNLKIEIEEALGKKINYTNAESFKSHPFLKYSESTCTFRYDFLGDIFRSIFISFYFDYSSSKIELSNAFLEVIAENCWLGSPINHEIVNRITHWDVDDNLLISDIISQINSRDNLGIKKRKIIANIFNLSIFVNHKFLNNDIFCNTELLKSLFLSRGNIVENLCILNIGKDYNIRFDFSGLEVRNAFIDNYSAFWSCNFDEHTKFLHSHLINLTILKKKSDASKAQFIDCTFDNAAESSLKKIDQSDENRAEQSKLFLNDFFHLFFSNGRLGRQWEDKIIKPRYDGINKYNHDYKKTIRILKKHGLLIITEEKEGIKFAISEDTKEDVIRFIKDGTISNIINKIIKDL